MYAWYNHIEDEREQDCGYTKEEFYNPRKCTSFQYQIPTYTSDIEFALEYIKNVIDKNIPLIREWINNVQTVDDAITVLNQRIVTLPHIYVPYRQYDYIRDVYGTILIRDLVEKYRIRNTSEFASISEFMMDNIGNLLSPNNICKTLNNDQREITRKTVSKYIGYLENAFLFYEAKRYDLKGKKYLENNSKFYLCDPAFRYAVNGTRNMDFGRVYENIVYLELRRRGYEVYVGKLYKKEVDFVAKKRDTLIYIQVSDNISDETTFEREYSPLLAIRDAYPKMVIARTHHETYDYQGVQVVDICRWLRCR